MGIGLNGNLLFNLTLRLEFIPRVMNAVPSGLKITVP